MRKKIAMMLGVSILLTGMLGCTALPNQSSTASTTATTADTTAQTTSPTTSTGVSATESVTVTEEATEEVDYKTLHKGENLAGSYEENIYTNEFMNFGLTVDGTDWKFFDSEGVASATGLTTSDVDNFWGANTSPYDAEISYCAIAYNTTTGSNIIISYLYPQYSNMGELTASDYLTLSARSYEGATVSKVSFFSDAYECMDIPKGEDDVITRKTLAKEKDGLILIITFTIVDGDEIDDMMGMFSQ